MSPNPLTPGLEFFKTCLSAFWKPESKPGNVLKNGTILNYLAGILHPMHGLGVPRSFCSGKWVGVELRLVARSGEIWSQILFGRRGCWAGKPHVQFSIHYVIDYCSCPHIVRFPNSQEGRGTFLVHILLDSCIFLDNGGVELVKPHF